VLPAKKSKRSNRVKRRCGSMQSQIDIDNELDKTTSKNHSLRNSIDTHQNPRKSSVVSSKKIHSQHHSPHEPRDLLHQYYHSPRYGSSYDLRKSNRLVLTKNQSNASSSTAKLKDELLRGKVDMKMVLRVKERDLELNLSNLKFPDIEGTKN
jgi:hypothetical protein